jgi:hypothetical protein
VDLAADRWISGVVVDAVEELLLAAPSLGP